jgi:Mrp family chromosome partitioning ATPase
MKAAYQLPNPQSALPSPQYLNVMDGLKLVHNLCPPGTTGNLVQFIAATSGEGTSTLLRDTALIAIRTPGLKVLILDNDTPGNKQLLALRDGLRLPVVASEPLADIAGEEAFIHRFAMSGLHVTEIPMSIGMAPRNWGKLLAVIRARFDLVLVDSPPLSRSHQGIAVAPDVDSNLLVVEAEHTRSAVAQNLRDELLSAEGIVRGVILNKRRFYVPSALYNRL